MDPAPSDPARLTVDSRCAHGEGVLWCERRQALLWVDIDGARLWMHLPAQGTSRSWPLPDRPGCIGLGQAGDLLLVLAKALYRADLDAALADGVDAVPLVQPSTEDRVARWGQVAGGAVPVLTAVAGLGSALPETTLNILAFGAVACGLGALALWAWRRQRRVA